MSFMSRPLIQGVTSLASAGLAYVASLGSMSRRWSGLHAFHWSPVLTFSRRRDEAFEWLESNVEVVAFFSGDDQFGVAVGSSDCRLVVRRDGFDVLLGSTASRVQGLHDALSRVLETFEPRHLHAASARLLWSHEVDVDYQVRRAAWAKSIAGSGAGASAVDFSALVDFESPGARMQVEYGLVDGHELRMRLTSLDMGRARAAEMPPVGDVPEALPGCSLFADTTWIAYGKDAYTGDTGAEAMYGYVEARVNLAEHETGALADRLAEIAQGGDDRNEHSCGA